MFPLLILLTLTIPTVTTFDGAWAAALALAALVVQAVAQPAWLPSWAKRLITVALAAVLAVVYFAATGQLGVLSVDVQALLVSWFVALIGFLVGVKALYEFFKPVLDKIETATTATVATTSEATTTATDAAEATDTEVASDDDATADTSSEAVTSEEKAAAATS